MIVDKLNIGDRFKDRHGDLVVVEKVEDRGGVMSCCLRRESGNHPEKTYMGYFWKASGGKIDLDMATDYEPCSPKKP